MHVRDLLSEDLKAALEAAAFPAEVFVIEHPSDLSRGDYATNAAMVLAGKLKQNPFEIAQKIADALQNMGRPYISSVEAVRPGFVNITLSREFFSETLGKILVDDSWGANDSRKGEKVIVEYTDPNPFKVMHIGHVMTNTIGEAIARLMEYSGAEVRRANYQGDVGMHVAKAVWALRKAGADPSDISVHGKAYADGAKAFESDEAAAEEIKVINKKIYDRSDAQINEIYDKGRKASLDHFELTYQTLGTKFDHYFFESEAGPRGLETVAAHPEVFVESDGAKVFKGEDYGLHTRVFVNAAGLPTYEAKELGLAQTKYEVFPYDASFIVTANEIDEYFKVLLKAMEFTFPDLSKKTTHIGHGMMRLKGGKMSSRTGDVITAEDFITDVKEKVLEHMTDRDVAEKERVATDVAVGAVKYVVLKGSTKQDIVYDNEQATSFEGDSGPYLQYAHTRAQSILEKAGEGGSATDAPSEPYPLERLLYRFPEVVKDAQVELQPHYVTTYLIQLAGAFNAFYASERILDAESHKAYKQALVSAFAKTMERGLSVLGIRVPGRM